MEVLKKRSYPSHFITKLRLILDNEQSSDIVQWDQFQGILHLKESQLFVTHILPRYFKHRSLKSFVRQLNLYGFRKIIRNKQTLIFRNPLFTKQNFEQGKFVKRNANRKKDTKIQFQLNNQVSVENCQSQPNQLSNQDPNENNNCTPQSTAVRPRIQSSCFIQHHFEAATPIRSIASIRSFQHFPVHYEPLKTQEDDCQLFGQDMSSFQYPSNSYHNLQVNRSF